MQYPPLTFVDNIQRTALALHGVWALFPGWGILQEPDGSRGTSGYAEHLICISWVCWKTGAVHHWGEAIAFFDLSDRIFDVHWQNFAIPESGMRKQFNQSFIVLEDPEGITKCLPSATSTRSCRYQVYQPWLLCRHYIAIICLTHCLYSSMGMRKHGSCLNGQTSLLQSRNHSRAVPMFLTRSRSAQCCYWAGVGSVLVVKYSGQCLELFNSLCT